jgi:hypothetical protein
VGTDGYVLQKRPKFVPDLGVECGSHALADQHSFSPFPLCLVPDPAWILDVLRGYADKF